MKNMNISKKLLLGFLIITMFAVVLAVIGIWAGAFINNNYTYLLETPVEQQDQLQEMRQQFTMMRYRAATFIITAADLKMINDTLIPQYNSAYSAFTNSLAAYMDINAQDTLRDTTVLQQYQNNASNLSMMVDQYKAATDKVLTTVLAGNTTNATNIMLEAIPLANNINTLLDEMIAPAEAYVSQSSADMDTTASRIMIIQILVTVFCAAFSIILALYISGQISKPLLTLTAFMGRASSNGDISLNKEDGAVITRYSQNKDEIGQCIGSTANFVKRLTEVSQTLESVANGDLRAKISLLSEQDTMGLSLQKMINNLNHMFGEINASTAQVSIGSKQIADGAQSLAQGSTQQAAAVQQLSGAIAEIAQKTKDNAHLAGQTATLAVTIKTNAEKGNQQMDEMMTAVKEINQASQSIGKVIKVIDDIAFQTNILALNAAVEAARAGQHGKGFAVVAEEVRNLAAKSAEAAKDTGVLISNSIEKAELGVRIADETASSLLEIVSGINESSSLIGNIAQSSEEQSAGIVEINNGIDQVAQVVQQNSATAEESAAASEEMSGQADTLADLVAQFKLKETAMDTLQSLPPASTFPHKHMNNYALGAAHEGLGKY